jgi:formate dehydrogenase accessory protein FdhD
MCEVNGSIMRACSTVAEDGMNILTSSELAREVQDEAMDRILDGIIVARTDIGRHNTLDKIYGYYLKHSITLEDKVIVFSKRISSKVLLKVAKIKSGVVLSKSAPTELALPLTTELGITAVGFISQRNVKYLNKSRANHSGWS